MVQTSREHIMPDQPTGEEKPGDGEATASGVVVAISPADERPDAGPPDAHPPEADRPEANHPDPPLPDPWEDGTRPNGRPGEAWPLAAARTWRAAKIVSGGLLLAWLLAWPIGSMWADHAATGTFTFGLGYSGEVLVLALTSAALVLGAGYALATGLRLEDSAERLREAAAGFAGPLGPRGAEAKREIGALNGEIDRALSRLADAESLIRRQVEAIDTVGAAIEAGTTRSTEKLETERQALMTLTEEMNREAESFADKIAERTREASDAEGSIRGRIEAAEQNLDGQVTRLEAVSSKSLERFETLATAMAGRSEALAGQAEAQGEAAAKLGDNQAALARAQAELAEQSERLEGLIHDQRRRANKLAKAVTDQTSRLAQMGRKEPPAKSRRGSWRDILAAVERTVPAREATASQLPERETPDGDIPAGAEPGAAARDGLDPDDMRAAMDGLVGRMQRFSLTLRTQLYGGPPKADLARFEAGERMVFVRQLLAEEPGELKARIEAEAGRNAVFDQGVREFLGDFDALIEPVSSSEAGDAAMAEYLKAPLGRLYVLVGTALGRFG